MTTDMLVETTNPEALDRIAQSFGAVLVGGGMPDGFVRQGDYYVLRVLGDPGFVRFALEHQGYAKVHGETKAFLTDVSDQRHD